MPGLWGEPQAEKEAMPDVGPIQNISKTPTPNPSPRNCFDNVRAILRIQD